MNLISREELKAKLDRGDDFKLVMAMGEWAFKMAHIPGSINISNMDQAERLLALDDEIVIYCAGGSCPASPAAYHYLVSHGFTNVRRYAGGITDWQEAGYPVEGDEEFNES
jgi:rhodanese-related sulfurtransferase